MGFLRRLFGGQPQVTSYDAWLLEPKRPDAVLEVVGEANYEEGIGKVAGGKTPNGAANPEHTAILMPQPENRHDPNVVMAVIESTLVGCLSRKNAIAYKPVIAYAESKAHKIACHAMITGGWDTWRDDTSYFGVALRAGSPMETMLELVEDTEDDVKVRTDHPWVGQLITFTGDSHYSVGGFPLDRAGSEMLACRAGMSVHPRVTKKVRLLVDCGQCTTPGDEQKAVLYGIPVVAEQDFWAAFGVPVTTQ